MLQCPKCQTTLAVPLGSAGELPPFVNCPGCGIALLIPTAAAKVATVAAPVVTEQPKPDPIGKPQEKLIHKLRIEPSGTRDFIPREEVEWDESMVFEDRRRDLTAPVAAETKRWPWIGGIVLALGVGYFLGWQSQQALSEPAVKVVAADAISPNAPSAVNIGEALPASEEAVKAARETLQRFVAASPEKKLNYVIDAQRVKPALEAYYAQGNRNDDILLGELAPLPQVERDVRRGILCFVAKHEDGLLLVAMRKEETEEDLPPVYKLDWETYVQEKERLLIKFVSSEGKDPTLTEGIFRVALRRSHLFDERDERLNRLGLRLSTPSGRIIDEPRVVVRSIDPLHQRIEKELGWNRTALATVRLVWEKDEKEEAPVLGIKEFYCWELAGVGGDPESPLPPIEIKSAP